MKFNLNTLIPPLIFAMPFGVMADELAYIGSNVSAISFKDGYYTNFGSNPTSDEARVKAIHAKIGQSFNDNFFAELRAGIGMSSDNLYSSTKVKLKKMYGLYTKVKFPLNEHTSPYLTLGYTKGEVEYGNDRSEYTHDESESDVSFGAGFDFKLKQNIILNIEYMNYLDKNDTEVTAFSIGIAKQF